MGQAVVVTVKLSCAHRALEYKLQLPFRETGHYSNPPKLRLTSRSYRSLNVLPIRLG